MKPVAVTSFVMLVAVLAAASPARAQFQTPSRAFHNATAFPLSGRHLTVPCESCHLNGTYKGTPNTCFECHWVRRQDDRFQTRLGTQCEQCHRPSAWSAVRWDHGATTGMPLNAAHKTIGCESCHKGGSFRAAALNCMSCHQKDYQATTNPNHAAAGFPTACETCHRPADVTFQQARFDHNAAFQLVGVHATVACAACHKNNVYKGTPRDCVGCHRPDYARSQNPNHPQAGFPTTCEQCHRPTDPTWHNGNSGFNHNAVFPLVGIHATQTCAACHKNSVYKGTPRDCVGCHRPDYDRTVNPNHAQAGFATTCDQCHRPTDPTWHNGNSGVNHNAVFPLVGVHATQACAACHINGVYKGTARDCAGCHRPLYERTVNPNHTAAGFPTTCDSCHRPTDPTWNQGSFTHTRFPITSGPHKVACAQCHTNPANYQQFSCTVCHARTTTDSHHRGENGYRYDSVACYSCHPNGRQ